MTQGEHTKPKAVWLARLLVVAVGVMLFWQIGPRGIRWGLPSAERNALYYTTPEAKDAAIELVRGRSARSANGSDEPLPRSVYNPIRSYHPDEYVVFKMLSRMDPTRLDVDPKWYVIGGAYVYPLGALLKTCGMTGLVTLKADAGFYIDQPEEMAKLYLVGRCLSLAFAAGAFVLVAVAARQMWGRLAGAVAAVMIVTSPLLVMHSKFMYSDVPGMFWVTVAIFASVGITTKGTPRWYVIAGLAVGLAAGTKLFHGFSLMIPLTTHFLCRRSDDSRTSHVRVLIVPLLAALMFLATNPYYVMRPSAVLANFADHFVGGTSIVFYLKAMGYSLGVLPLVAAIVGGAFAVGRRERFALILGVWAVAYVALLSTGGKDFARYLMPVLPVAAMLCAYAAAAATEKSGNARERSQGGQKRSQKVQNRSQTGHESATIGHNRSLLAARPSSRRLMVVICLLVVVALPQLITNAEINVAMSHTDSRTRAGQIITRVMPASSRIAVTEEPWQFEMPPLDPTHFEIAVCGYDLEKLKAVRPKVFVFTDLQSDATVNPHPDIPEEAAFWEGLINASDADTWTILTPRLAGLLEYKFLCVLGLWNTPPEDLRYVSPRVYLAFPAGSAEAPKSLELHRSGPR